MVREQITLSIGEEMGQWLRAHPSIIPSHLLQTTINQLMEAENSEILGANADLKKKLEILSERFHKALGFLEKKGLVNEFWEENASQ